MSSGRACDICGDAYGGRVVPTILTCCLNHVCFDCAENYRNSKISELAGNKKKIKCMYCNQLFHSSKDTPWKVNKPFIEVTGINVDLSAVKEAQAAMQLQVVPASRARHNSNNAQREMRATRAMAQHAPMQDNAQDMEEGDGEEAGSSPIDFPDLPKWHSVSKRRIPQVGVAVLTLLREADGDELFHRPVCEDYPEFARDYLQKVENPMDFTTIEEERLCSYGHIAELQEDLILTFRNCCVYNGQGHEYTTYAIHIWKSLNEVFEEAQSQDMDGGNGEEVGSTREDPPPVERLLASTPVTPNERQSPGVISVVRPREREDTRRAMQVIAQPAPMQEDAQDTEDGDGEETASTREDPPPVERLGASTLATPRVRRSSRAISGVGSRESAASIVEESRASKRTRSVVENRPTTSKVERERQRGKERRERQRKQRNLKKKLFTVDFLEMMRILNVYGPEHDISYRKKCKKFELVDHKSIQKHFAMWNPNFFKYFIWYSPMSCFVVKPGVVREKGDLPEGWVPFKVNIGEIMPE